MKKFLLIILILSGLILSAQDKCPVDFEKNEIPQSLVIDYAGIIDDRSELQLKNKLEDFSNETSNQILVLTVKDLCGMDVSTFANRIGYNWGVGQDEFSNGVVVVIKPTGGKGERRTTIAVGTGLQGAIPDAIAKRIIEIEMIPEFRQNNFEGGINNATEALMGLAAGEISTDKYARPPVDPRSVVFGLIALIIAFFILFRNMQRVRRNSIGNDLPFWTAFWLLSNSGHRRHSGWRDFHSGGGSFGGGSGFGGFGGGSFNGGGASGSW